MQKLPELLLLVDRWIDNKNDPTCFGRIADVGDTIDSHYLPYILKKFLVSLTDHIQSIDLTALNSICQDIDPVPESFIITEMLVFNVLSHAKFNQSVCDDCCENLPIFYLDRFVH